MGRWVNGYSVVGIGRIDLGHNNHGKKRNYFRLCWLNKPSGMEDVPNGAKRDNSWPAGSEDDVLRRSAGGQPGQAGCVYCVRARSIAWKYYICVSLPCLEWERESETGRGRERERRYQIVWSPLAVNPTVWCGQQRGNNCGNISIPTAVDPNQDTNHSSSVKALIGSWHRYRRVQPNPCLLKLWLQLRLRLWLFASRNSLEFFLAFVVMFFFFFVFSISVLVWVFWIFRLCLEAKILINSSKISSRHLTTWARRTGRGGRVPVPGDLVSNIFKKKKNTNLQIYLAFCRCRKLKPKWKKVKNRRAKRQKPKSEYSTVMLSKQRWDYR